jgi:hypothetical protein
MSALISFHPGLWGTPKIAAHARFTEGAPLEITICDANGIRHGEISIFTGSFALTAALAAAINGAAERAEHPLMLEAAE